MTLVTMLLLAVQFLLGSAVNLFVTITSTTVLVLTSLGLMLLANRMSAIAAGSNSAGRGPGMAIAVVGLHLLGTRKLQQSSNKEINPRGSGERGFELPLAGSGSLHPLRALLRGLGQSVDAGLE